jgi:hypothetical protein
MRYRSDPNDTRSEKNRLGLAVVATLAIVMLMVAIITLTQAVPESIDENGVLVQAPSQPLSLDTAGAQPARTSDAAAQ